MLFYVEYNCGYDTQCAIVNAESQGEAEDWAVLEAEQMYYLGEDNEEIYPFNEDDFEELIYTEPDFYYHIEDFDEENDEHLACLDAQGNEPIEI